MTSARSLLIPIDGSDHALRALRYALERQRVDRRLRLMLLNVQPAMPTSRFVTRAMIREYHDRNSHDALKAALKLMTRQKRKFEAFTRVGEPARAIVDFAAEAGCVEIAMGTRGLGRVKGLLLGSIATKVVYLSDVPVTVVP